MKSIKDYLLILEAEPIPTSDAGTPPVDVGTGTPSPDAGMVAPVDPNAPPQDPNTPVDPNASPDMNGAPPPPDMGGMGGGMPGGGGGMGGAPGQPGAIDPQATEVIKQKLKENPFWRDIIKKGTGFDTIKMGREFSKETKLANKKRGV